MDLADLYGVETKQLKRAVRRNNERFPDDFMFILTNQEVRNLRCQIGTSNRGGTRYPPIAFTEQGVAMLSTVLNSKRAIQVNIQISDWKKTSDHEDVHPTSTDAAGAQRFTEKNRNNGREVR